MLKVSSSNLHESGSFIGSTGFELSPLEKMTHPAAHLESTAAPQDSSSTVVSTEGDQVADVPQKKTANANPLNFLANVTFDMFSIHKAATMTGAQITDVGVETATPIVKDTATKIPSPKVDGGKKTKKKISNRPSTVPPSKDNTKKRKSGNAAAIPSSRKARKGDAARVVEAMLTSSMTSPVPSTVMDDRNYLSNATTSPTTRTAAGVGSSKVGGGMALRDDDFSAKDDSAKYDAYLASYASAVKDARTVLNRVESPISHFSDDLWNRQRQLEREMEALRREELIVLREREIMNALRDQELIAAMRQQRHHHEMMANMEDTLNMNDYGSSLGAGSFSRLEMQIQQEMQRQQQVLLECRLLSGSSSLSKSSGFGGPAASAEAAYSAGRSRDRIGSIADHLLPIQNAHQMTSASRFLAASAANAFLNPTTAGEGMVPASSSELGRMMNRSSPVATTVTSGERSSPTSSVSRAHPVAKDESTQDAAAPKRLAPARGVFNKNIKTQDEVLDTSTRANSRRLQEGDQNKKFGQRFRSYQCEQWTSKFQELLTFKDQMGNCQVPHAYKKNIELARWVKRQRYQYKLMVEGKQSTMTAERVKLLEGIGFIWDSHAATWEERLNELRDYASVNGDCNVPSSYRENPKLATWIKCQRRQFKLLHEGKTSNMTMERMTELERAGFCWRVQER